MIASNNTETPPTSSDSRPILPAAMVLLAALGTGCTEHDLIRTRQVLDTMAQGMQQTYAQQPRLRQQAYQPATPKLRLSFRSSRHISDSEHVRTLNQRIHDMDHYGY